VKGVKLLQALIPVITLRIARVTLKQLIPATFY